MEADPTLEGKTISLGLLLFHTIAIPFRVFLQLFIYGILVNDTMMTQSIIGEIEYLEFIVTAHHQIVCHDGDETLGIITHPIQDILPHHFIELTSLIHHQVQWFHFLFILSFTKLYPHPYSLFIVFLSAEVFLGSFLIHPFLVHVIIQGVIISECISK